MCFYKGLRRLETCSWPRALGLDQLDVNLEVGIAEFLLQVSLNIATTTGTADVSVDSTILSLKVSVKASESHDIIMIIQPGSNAQEPGLQGPPRHADSVHTSLTDWH